MSAELDRTDRNILRHLQQNGRLSNTELASLTNTSPATCHRRTQRLFEDGYISSVRAHIAPEKVERGTLVMVGVVPAAVLNICRRCCLAWRLNLPCGLKNKHYYFSG